MPPRGDAVRAERDVAAALGARERVALGRHGRAARRMSICASAASTRASSRRHWTASAPWAGAGTNRCGIEPQHGDVGESAAEALLGLQALDAGGREHDGVEAAFLEAAHARRHVAAQRLDGEVGAKVREPRAPARRRRADARACFQRQPVVGRAGERVAAHEQEIGGIDARRHGRDRRAPAATSSAGP